MPVQLWLKSNGPPVLHRSAWLVSVRWRRAVGLLRVDCLRTLRAEESHDHQKPHGKPPRADRDRQPTNKLRVSIYYDETVGLMIRAS